MNRADTLTVLTAIQALERRTGPAAEVPEPTEDAWSAMLTDVTMHDAMTAVRQHYASSRWPITLAEVIAHAAKMRAARLEACPVDRLPLPPEVEAGSVRDYIAWKRTTTAQVADGTYLEPPPARAVGPVPDVSQVLRSVPVWTRTQREAAERERRAAINEAAEVQRTASLAALDAAMAREAPLVTEPEGAR